MANPSPAFAINSGAVNAKASVGASGAIVATLDNVDGVRSVQWSISRTDETTTAASYTLIQSGSVGQTVSTNALGPGTAAVLKAVINGGLDAQTDQPNANTVQEVKFFVPDSGGLELLCAGELNRDDVVASDTHGAVDPINAAIRRAAVGNEDWKSSVRCATDAALPANTFDSGAGTITMSAVGVLTVDGIATVLGDRVLVKDEGGGSDVANGWYDVTTEGDGGTAAVLTRSLDADADGELTNGSRSYVSEGTANAETVWVCNTLDPIAVNTDPISFAEAGGAGGDVVGPASSGDNQVALFNGTTGKLLKTSNVFVTGGVNVATSGYFSAGVTPATVGQFRTSTGGSFQFRNAGNTGNVNAMALDGSDGVLLNQAVAVSATGEVEAQAGLDLQLKAPGGQNVAAYVNSLLVHSVNATGVFIEANYPFVIRESSGDAIQTLNASTVYSKDVSGVTQLFHRASDGTIHQLTPAGDVVGPGSSIDSELALFDSTTGKLLKGGSGITSPFSGGLTGAATTNLALRGGSDRDLTLQPGTGGTRTVRILGNSNRDRIIVGGASNDVVMQDSGSQARLTMVASGATATFACGLLVDSITAAQNYFDLDDGNTAPISAAGHVRFRSNGGSLEVSENGGAWAALGGGVTGSGTDNRMMRWNGTGAAQDSLIDVADTTGSLVWQNPSGPVEINLGTQNKLGPSTLNIRAMNNLWVGQNGGDLNLYSGTHAGTPAAGGSQLTLYNHNTTSGKIATLRLTGNGSCEINVGNPSGQLSVGRGAGVAIGTWNGFGLTIHGDDPRRLAFANTVTSSDNRIAPLSDGTVQDLLVHGQDRTDGVDSRDVTMRGGKNTGAGADGSAVIANPDGTAVVTVGTAATFATPPVVPSYTVAGLPSASPAAQIAYVSDETGGAVLAFSDGTNWRRVTDRAIAA